MLQRSILCMQSTQYATKRSILCRGAFCGPTTHSYLDVFMIMNFFLQFWEGVLGPSRVGKLVW